MSPHQPVRHMTASAVVFNPAGEVLLVHHRLYRVWVVPGGHIEAGELPHDAAALREVLEETGVEARVVDPRRRVPALPGLDVLPSPWLVAEMDHPGNPDKGELPHRHVDLCYLAEALTVDLTHQADEVHGARWVPVDERLHTLPTRPDVIPMVTLAYRDWFGEHRD